ncbi:MAG: hypothetical protein ACE3JU_01545 [Paenibacillus sp.]|uniref:hypothetical protein n=1 Tax=Paenibacillus sp. TaxID=58172 RepID=UPI003B7EA426
MPIEFEEILLFVSGPFDFANFLRAWHKQSEITNRQPKLMHCYYENPLRWTPAAPHANPPPPTAHRQDRWDGIAAPQHCDVFTHNSFYHWVHHAGLKADSIPFIKLVLHGAVAPFDPVEDTSL